LLHHFFDMRTWLLQMVKLFERALRHCKSARRSLDSIFTTQISFIKRSVTLSYLASLTCIRQHHCSSPVSKSLIELEVSSVGRKRGVDESSCPSDKWRVLKKSHFLYFSILAIRVKIMRYVYNQGRSKASIVSSKLTIHNKRSNWNG
jgi:hypothetical protein